jgi:hypothetical protein
MNRFFSTPTGVRSRVITVREENAKRKRLVADLSLDKHNLQEILSKSSEP